jgi:hypothetical protein
MELKVVLLKIIFNKLIMSPYYKKHSNEVMMEFALY